MNATPTLSKHPKQRSPRRRYGLPVALALGMTFIAVRLPELPVNFQVDGQIPEYQAWAAAPETLGASLNSELNPYLYSFYYYGLGSLGKVIDRIDSLRLTFAIEILALCAAVYYLVTTLTRNRWAAWIAVTVTVWHDGTAVCPGGTSGLGVVTGAEYPAIALALVALALSWRRRHVAAAALAGLAFNLHGSVALFVSLMVLTAAAVDAPRALWANIVRPGLVCLAAASPTVLWILFDPPPAATMSTTDWLRFPRWIYVNHMFASATPLKLWLMLFVFVLPGILGMAARTSSWGSRTRILSGWIACSAALLIIGYVFVEWIPVRPIAQLTLWRGTRFLAWVLLAFGLAHLVGTMRAGGFAAMAAALTLTAYVTPVLPELAWMGHLGLAGLLAVTATRAAGLGRSIAILALAAMCGILVYDTTSFHRLGDHLVWRWPLIILGISATFVWAARSDSQLRRVVPVITMLAAAVWLARLDVGRPFSSLSRRRAAAIRQLAPRIADRSLPGELVIAPPDIRNPGAWARRGSYLCRQQLTAYAYAPWLAERIIERARWYMDGPVEDIPHDRSLVHCLREGYKNRRSEDFARLRERFDVRLAIVENGRRLAFEAVAANDLFTVYDLAEPRPAALDGATPVATALDLQ